MLFKIKEVTSWKENREVIWALESKFVPKLQLTF